MRTLTRLAEVAALVACGWLLAHVVAALGGWRVGVVLAVVAVMLGVVVLTCAFLRGAKDEDQT